jgi:hypothetical protein
VLAQQEHCIDAPHLEEASAGMKIAQHYRCWRFRLHAVFNTELA